MKAVGNKIIIELEKENEQTKAGLFMPEDATKSYKIGKVVSVGPGEKDTPMEIAVGDRVMVQKRAGSEVIIDEKPYTVVSQLEVLVVL
jgi:chaperonin GroES